MSRHFLNREHLPALADVLPHLGKIEGSLTVRVTMEDLQKLEPDQCRAFLDGIAKVLAANVEIERNEGR